MKVLLFILLILTVIITGCSQDENPVNPNLPANPKIMFVNASPFGDSSLVRFIVYDDTLNAVTVKYGSYIGYRDLKSGSANIKVIFLYVNDTVTLNLTKNFEKENFYSCVAYDAGSPSSAAAVFLNDLPVLPDFRTIKIRVVNFLASEQPVDFYLIPGLILFHNIDFTTASAFLQAEPGTFDFSVKYSSDTSHIILPIHGQNLSLPRAYSYILAGYPASPVYIKTVY